MKCGHCGHELQEGRRVCGICGKTQAFAVADDLPFRPAPDPNVPADVPKIVDPPKKKGPKNSIKIKPPGADMSPAFRPAEGAFDPPAGAKHAHDAVPPTAPLPAGGFSKPAELETAHGMSKTVEPKPIRDRAKPIEPRSDADLSVPGEAKPAHGASMPFSPVRPAQKTWNWKPLVGMLMALGIVIGSAYAIFEGDLFSGSGSGGSRKKNDSNDGSNFGITDDIVFFDDDSDIFFNDHDDDDDPAPAIDRGYDCPACTNGWHDLCYGSGIYRNYGQEVECSCDDGRCTVCDGSGWID